MGSGWPKAEGVNHFNSRVVFSFFFGTLLSLGTPISAAEQAKPLIVGMELSYPPFEMTDTTGKPAGVSVDLASDLALQNY